MAAQGGTRLPRARDGLLQRGGYLCRERRQSDWPGSAAFAAATTLGATATRWSTLALAASRTMPQVHAMDKQCFRHAGIGFTDNRAAETVAGGKVDDAYWLARAALSTVPDAAIAANTLAVIYTARGLPAASEQALRYALAPEPGNFAALTNLGQMLAAEGRTAEAEIVDKKLADVQRYRPFYFFGQGMKAPGSGGYKSAADLFEKETSQRPYDDQSHFGLAIAALHLGDTKRARRQLELAVEKSTTVRSRELYAAKLRHLRQ